jgi:hypothetical protein
MWSLSGLEEEMAAAAAAAPTPQKDKKKANVSAMVNQPPVRLTLSLPLSEHPLQSYSPAVVHAQALTAPLQYRIGRDPDNASLPRFAFNKTVDPASSSKWVEPCPASIRHHGARTFSICSKAIVRYVLGFCDSATLDVCCVHVCRDWHSIVSLDPQLQQQRMAFLHSGTDYDTNGILYYLGSRAGKAARRGKSTLYVNPATGPRPLVGVEYSQVLLTKGNSAGRREAFVAHGVGEFATESIPFAWVGVDFRSFRVRPTAYTVGISSAAGAPKMTDWELQACRDDGEDWAGHRWFVLDVRSGWYFKDSPSATFTVPSAGQHREAWRKFRIVQTNRNSQWGHELCISGFEVFGNLFSTRGASASW